MVSSTLNAPLRTYDKLVIARNDKSSLTDLKRVMESNPAAKVRVALINHPKLSDNLLAPYVHDPSANVRIGMANFTRNESFLEELAKDEDERVVLAVAFNSRSNQKILDNIVPTTLAQKRALASNHNTSMKLLRSLLWEPEGSVSEALIKQQGIKLEELVTLDELWSLPEASRVSIASYSRNQTYTTFLFKNQAVNSSVWQGLAANPHISREVLDALIEQGHSTILNRITATRHNLTAEHVKMFLDREMFTELSSLFSRQTSLATDFSNTDLLPFMEKLLNSVNIAAKRSLLPSFREAELMSFLFYECYSDNADVRQLARENLALILNMNKRGLDLALQSKRFIACYTNAAFPEVDFNTLPLEWVEALISGRFNTLEAK